MALHPKKVLMVFALGWAIGVLGVQVAGAGSKSEGVAPAPREERKPSASESVPRYAEPNPVKEDRVECQVGEERNSNGDCVRPYTFDRPFRRGGR